ncbi:tetratricopeptide repeat protein [Algoriphagus sp.]|uniref:tetratricopeptide repeat protein n=1 Tax=Algoriphagus sp. TaxID=1872435 RepID=UPI003F726D74
MNTYRLLKILTSLFILLGGFLALYYLIIDPLPYKNIQAGSFLDTIAIPFDWAQVGPISFPIKVDNYLIFQEFKTLAPKAYVNESYIYAGIVWLGVISILTLLTEFRKTYFILGGIIWIVLLTLSNFNGLNIGGQSANYPLIILLSATLTPMVCFHLWGQSAHLILKWLVIAAATFASLVLLIFLSPLPKPSIYLAEHSLMPGFGLALAWVFWNGHSILSGTYILLARANRHLNLNITLQISLITLIYLGALFSIFLALQGELPFPVFSPLYLLIPIGVLGYISMNEKVSQSDQPASSPAVIKALHLLGFGLVLWLVWKLKLSGNQPAEELLKHLLTYSQLGFSLFFFIYLMANFMSVMNSGQAIDKILYKPYSLVYYHIRIGGLIVILVLTTYTGGIVGVQANAMTSNILAEYYYKTDQKLEASILYENSWKHYRKNPKAKFVTAQLLLDLKQPTLAKEHLEESFTEAPQVDNILLLADRLHQENKVFESIYYLEKGLQIFPSDNYLANNLSLLYTKINKSAEALELLNEDEISNPVLASNLVALKTKLGQPEEEKNSSTDLISQLNELATVNALANIPSSELILSIRNKLKTENSPMLLNAGWRNLFSEINRANPTEDLEFLDSLGQLPEMTPYVMSLQETAVIRSLGAGRVTGAVKNLNGLAFRNPNDAAYYLQLSGSILAKNMDFQKAALEFIAAEEKGFQGFGSHHWSIFGLAGMPEKSIEIKEKYSIPLPEFIKEEDTAIAQFLSLISRFHQQSPKNLLSQWRSFPENALKTDIAIRLIAYKAHGLSGAELKELEKFISNKIGIQEQLSSYVNNPDLTNKESVASLVSWLRASSDLTANPYLSPLIISDLATNSDPLDQYEILNSATEFNQDPILWVKKIKAARESGLDKYADEAQEILRKWVSEEELETLQNLNY